MRKLSQLLVFTIAVFLTDCTTPASTTTPAPQEQEKEIAQSFKLYPTTNMWTFVKLDTRNGKMWQVQYSVKGDEYRFETVLNPNPLVPEGKESGRFELYPTQNMFNFILLDCVEGKTWQVQWSADAKNRVIMPIQ